MAKPANARKIITVVFLGITTVLLSLLPEARIENITHTSYNYYVDLFQHSFYYFVLALVSFWIFPGVSAWLVAVVLFGISLGLEITQHYVPARSSSLHDLVSNFSGISVALMVVLTVRYIKRRRLISYPEH